jgi:hypothetical protein
MLASQCPMCFCILSAWHKLYLFYFTIYQKASLSYEKLLPSNIVGIISHNEVLFSHILPEIQASFKDLKQFLIEVS